jgi:hypothetical protein
MASFGGSVGEVARGLSCRARAPMGRQGGVLPALTPLFLGVRHYMWLNLVGGLWKLQGEAGERGTF